MWLLATRSRFSNCKRFLEAWHATKANSPVYLRMDEDDPQLEEVLALPWPKQFIIKVGPRARLGECATEMFKTYPSEPWYGMLGDDVIPGTDYWDRRLIERAGTHDISAGNDVHEKKIRIIHPCVGGDLVRLVGWFALPGLKHLAIDTVWEEIHHHFGRNNQMEDVILEHAHFFFDQASVDKTYQEGQSWKAEDRRIFREWKEKEMPQLLAKIQDVYGWVPKQ